MNACGSSLEAAAEAMPVCDERSMDLRLFGEAKGNKWVLEQMCVDFVFS